jgi:hypothetical protein
MMNNLKNDLLHLVYGELPDAGADLLAQSIDKDPSLAAEYVSLQEAMHCLSDICFSPSQQTLNRISAYASFEGAAQS